MTGPDLRSLTSDADFSEEVDAQDESLRVPEHVDAAITRRASPDDVPIPGLRHVAVKGPKWRLAELKASARRLAEMVPNELERVRRRRAQWLGEM